MYARLGSELHDLGGSILRSLWARRPALGGKVVPRVGEESSSREYPFTHFPKHKKGLLLHFIIVEFCSFITHIGLKKSPNENNKFNRNAKKAVQDDISSKTIWIWLQDTVPVSCSLGRMLMASRLCTLTASMARGSGLINNEAFTGCRVKLILNKQGSLIWCSRFWILVKQPQNYIDETWAHGCLGLARD